VVRTLYQLLAMCNDTCHCLLPGLSRWPQFGVGHPYLLLLSVVTSRDLRESMCVAVGAKRPWAGDLPPASRRRRTEDVDVERGAPSGGDEEGEGSGTHNPGPPGALVLGARTWTYMRQGDPSRICSGNFGMRLYVYCTTSWGMAGTMYIHFTSLYTRRRCHQAQHVPGMGAP
jgi:hypothetical protein